MTGYFTRLERELVAAAARQERAVDAQTRAPAKSRWARRPGRVALIALGALVLTGVPAAAVTGVFTPHREPDGLVRLSERRVIVEGTAPTRGPWQLTASQSDHGFCFGMRVSDGLPGSPMTGREGCGGATPGTLSVATSSGGTLRNNALVFGMTPDEAHSVRVTEGDVTVTVRTLDDNAGLPGRFYFTELPIRRSLGHTTVLALDENGQVIGKAEIGQWSRGRAR